MQTGYTLAVVSVEEWMIRWSPDINELVVDNFIFEINWRLDFISNDNFTDKLILHGGCIYGSARYNVKLTAYVLTYL